MQAPSESINVLLVGFGAVGVIYSYILEKAGARTTVVARSNYEQVKVSGITISSQKWGNHIHRPYRVAKSVQDAIESGTAFSYVLVTTKYLPDITTTTQILQPLLSDSYVHPVLPTVVLMQNGLGIEEDIYAALKSHPKTVSTAMIISCAVYITVSLVDDGSVSHGPFEKLVIGVYRETESSHVTTNSTEEQNLLDHFAMLLRGSDVEIATSYLAARFYKNIWNATVGVISAMSGHPWHSWILLPAAQATTKELFPALTAEIIAVGRAIGLTEEQLPNNAGELTVERSMELVKSGVKHIPSILLDVMNRRPIEVEGTLGFLVKKGRSHNVAVPKLEILYHILSIQQVSLRNQTSYDAL